MLFRSIRRNIEDLSINKALSAGSSGGLNAFIAPQDAFNRQVAARDSLLAQVSSYFVAAKSRGELPNTQQLVFSGTPAQQVQQLQAALTGFKEEARAKEDKRRLEEQQQRDAASLQAIESLNSKLGTTGDKTDALAKAINDLYGKKWEVNVFVDGKARQPVPAY